MYVDMCKDYKFYLSFENAYCKDYVTEKFFSALKTESIIPVALGGLERSDYNRIAPPGSYIHVEDFDSPLQLAKHLEFLSKNETAYNQYLWWTDHYRVTSLLEGYESAQCELCDKLNKVREDNLRLSPINLSEYWSHDTHCKMPK